jgi:thiol:disulfide interchange protein DsbA
VPAIFNDRWALDAAIFYTFEAMGVLDKMHNPFFDAIHRERLKSDNKQALTEWLQKQGLDPKKFDDTMRSFGVQTKVRRAAQLTAAYKIDGTPAMAVHGRYTVSTEQGRTREGMFETVDYLAATIRKSK